MKPLEDRAGDARAVLIAGPTASGKSEAALRLAEVSARRGREAVIVNADAMQVYDALRVVTARPGAAETRRAPHRLYGHVPAETRYSVGAWLSDAEQVLREAESAGKLPIIVGGTGLYFKALTEGLVAAPRIPASVRDALAARLGERGPAALHADLAGLDPRSAEAIRPSDPQRILRALEVIEATGAPFSAWRSRERAQAPFLPVHECLAFVLEPERAALYRRVEARLDGMVAQGALTEVEALLQRGLAPDLPVMKAIGVREFGHVLRDGAPLNVAVAKAKTETRRYAKRQMTWFRNQMADWSRLAA